MTATHPELAALLTRIENLGEPTTDYDLASILGVLYVDRTTVDQVSDADLYKLLLQYTVEDQTDIPCPDWCDHEHGHVFELSSGDGTEQSRHHSKRFLTATEDDREVGEFYIAVKAEETRLKPVDATATVRDPYVWAQVDGDLTVEQCRRFAAALTLAADELERIAR